MNLTRQPPRRPTNLGIAGIVGAARMTDKARAANEETLGDYIYGQTSGLDQRVLAFLGISADGFAEAVKEHDDAALSDWVLETSGKTAAEIAAFNEERAHSHAGYRCAQTAVAATHRSVCTGAHRY